MYYISIDAQEDKLSDGVKIANNSCEKIISSGKRWELSHQPITISSQNSKITTHIT
jgi:hypothetical protein